MTPSDRPIALRLAHLHLRMGSFALARAELELIDGSGALDAAALLDLAEARWRTGDLARAGESADRALEGGVDDPLALVIAAEAAAARGRHAEADDLAGRALEDLGTTLDALFAGMPRSAVWPGDPQAAMAPVPASDAGEAGVVGDADADDAEPVATEVPVAAEVPADVPAEVPAEVPVTADVPPEVPAEVPVTTEVSSEVHASVALEALADGRAALATGDVAGAALGLSLAIRLDPQLAEDILAAIGDGGSAPLLGLVAGDALRLLGRDREAAASYDRARRPVPDQEAGPG